MLQICNNLPAVLSEYLLFSLLHIPWQHCGFRNLQIDENETLSENKKINIFIWFVPCTAGEIEFLMGDLLALAQFSYFPHCSCMPWLCCCCCCCCCSRCLCSSSRCRCSAGGWRGSWPPSSYRPAAQQQAPRQGPRHQLRRPDRRRHGHRHRRGEW